MIEDRQILRDIWDGRIPVCFTLSQDEYTSPDQPDVYYLLVPRLSYFPIVSDKVVRFFSQYVQPDTQGEMWLEFQGQPLKWHYPIGVLYDLYAADQDQLPWNVIVHFQKFPESELLRCGSRDAVESHFIATVKEADALKHRGVVMSGMQKRDHKQLWSGLRDDKFEEFWTINRRLMEQTVENQFRSIPFRIYQIEQPLIQKLFQPLHEDGKPATLKELLEQMLPSVLTPQPNNGGSRVLIQGIEPPLETPLVWLSEYMSHPDNFLHICITSRSLP
ncbi:PREDICTED: autophagy protein 5-like [Priapulus caudatus]|uniref:Autophagy protein 5 n=1 Tax=Priapulus caudatus TaxID=37621 RepID=A0ABM1E4U4_PRICU|nr:PREDICTED: autophagy protein 5-like [Priapulus caudatus]XP_014667214.1 PREDICTED: autophagy protein 5-like [Priapulus caudatus]XP_014667215.1 PREDICTED: autophagy protein 5-like [Priapulus caudatus]